MKNLITVTCSKNDPKKFTAPKFDSYGYRERCDDPSNENFGRVSEKTINISRDEYTPNGIYNVRHLRKLSPDVSKLSGLAKFLAENLAGSSWGSIHGQNVLNPFQRCYAIRVTSKYSQCDIWIMCGKMSPERAANYAKCYGDLVTGPATLFNYVMPIIGIEESDEEYFERAAREIKNIDGLKNCVASVKIGENTWSDSE